MKKQTVDIDLSRSAIFTGLGEDKIARIAATVTIKDYPADRQIIKEGESGNNLFILLDGEVEVSKSMVLRSAGGGVDPRDKSLIRLTSKSLPFFGEMSLFDKESARSASVSTVNPCKFAVINLAEFAELAESDHEIGYKTFKNIARVLSDRLHKTNDDLMKVTTALGIALER